MVRRGRWVDKRTPTMSWEEAVYLTALGGKPRPTLPACGPDALPAVVIRRVLCCYCKEYHPPAEVDTCMVLPRKKTGTESSSSSTSNVLDAGPLKPFSQLWAFLTSTVFEDGTSRKGGRLSVSFASGQLALLLTDDESSQYACLNGRSLDDLLADAELRLEADTMPWRPSRWQGGGRRK